MMKLFNSSHALLLSSHIHLRSSSDSQFVLSSLQGFFQWPAIRLFGSFLTGQSKEEWERGVGATLLKLNAKQSKEAVEVWKCGRLWKHQKMNILGNHHHKDK
ncbi:unnamed protein product, partial [Brassica oleracea]